MHAADEIPWTPVPPYPAAEPPGVLYHAVPADRVETALREGLQPTGRPHVHLSRRADHARSALKEEERPVILQVDARSMHAEGHRFYVSPKATWLVHHVPADRLQIHGPAGPDG